MSASSASTATATPSASSAFSACSPRPPIRARSARSLTCAARSTPRCGARASIRMAIPARRWSTCWRVIRATSCSRSTTTRSTSSRWRSCSSRSARACACWRGRDRFDRFVSVLVYVPRERFDSKVRARIGAYLAEAYKGHVSAYYPTFPGRRHRPRSFHHRPQGRRDARSRPRHAGAGGRCDRPHLERYARREGLLETQEPGRARALFERYGDGVLRRLSRGLSAGGCARGHPGHREPLGGSSARRRVLSAQRGRQALRRTEGVEPRQARSRCRSACRCWKTWASGSSTSAPSRSAASRGAWLHDMVLERADGSPADARNR